MKCGNCRYFRVMHFRNKIEDDDKGVCNNKKRIKEYFKLLRERTGKSWSYESPIEEKAGNAGCPYFKTERGGKKK